jgi:hypothetical protein
MPTSLGFGGDFRFRIDAEGLGASQDWITIPPAGDKGNIFNTGNYIYSNGVGSRQSFKTYNNGALSGYKWLSISYFGDAGPGGVFVVKPYHTIGGVQPVFNIFETDAVGASVWNYLFTCSPTVYYNLEFGLWQSSGPAFPKARMDLGSSSMSAYGYPALVSLDVVSGSTTGGTVVTLTGTEFYANVSTPTVTFGGVAATGIVFLSTTSIRCTTPAHAAGAVDVVVTCAYPDTSTELATLAGGYTYVSSVPPSSESIVGSGGVEVLGTSTPPALAFGISATGAPPELHLNQWGLEGFTLQTDLEEHL